MFRNAKVADYRSPAWDAWRTREQSGSERPTYCSGCGFAHRKNNHAPRRVEEVIAREADQPHSHS